MSGLDAVHAHDFTSTLNEQFHVFGVTVDDFVRVLAGRLKGPFNKTIAHENVRAVAKYGLMNTTRDDVVQEGYGRTLPRIVLKRLA